MGSETISIRHTRNLLNATLNGDLENVEYYTDQFWFLVPKSCPECLNPCCISFPGPTRPNIPGNISACSTLIDNFKKFTGIARYSRADY
jgi:ATP-dependent phosphoenolpyruvate carboxykinase